MALRITRQCIEALVTGDTSLARVSRVYLQVLSRRNGTIFNVSAANALLLTSEITGLNQPIDGIVNNDITIINNAVVYEENQLTASELTITSEVAVEQKRLHQICNSEFSIISTADGGGEAARNPYSLLNITSAAVVEHEGITTAFTTIDISSTAKTHLHTRICGNTLDLSTSTIGKNTSIYVNPSNALEITSGSVGGGTGGVEVSSALTEYRYVVDPDTGLASIEVVGLRSQTTFELIKDSRSTSNSITISQSTEFALDRDNYFERSCTSFLAIMVTTDIDPECVSILNITNIAIADLFSQPRSRLEITQTVERELEMNRGLSSTLTLTQTVRYDLIKTRNVCSLQSYDPSIGSSSNPNTPNAPSTVAPETSRSDNVILRRGNDILTLRLPELGNRDRLDFMRIKRTTRGGTLIVFADPIWPKIQHMQLDFIALSENESQDILTFIENTLGQEIVIYDWVGRNWYGFITNPDTSITRDGRDMFSIALELDVSEESAYLGDTGNTIIINSTAIAELI